MCGEQVSMNARMNSSTWNPNISPAGWYVATYVQRFEFEGEASAISTADAGLGRT